MLLESSRMRLESKCGTHLLISSLSLLANSAFASAPIMTCMVVRPPNPYFAQVRPILRPTYCVSTWLRCLGSAMARVSACPYSRPGHAPPSGQWVALPAGVGCPALPQQLLAVHELVWTKSTSTYGNCGISACVISLLALLKGGQCQKGTSTEVRRLQSLRRCPPGQQVTQARAAAIKWLGQHSRTKLWKGMTVSGLTRAVTGEDFPSYVQRMQRNGD